MKRIAHSTLMRGGYMSAELSKARQQLAQIRIYLKQGKLVTAAQALHNALLAMFRQPLLKNEREEFVHLITDAVSYLSNDEGIRKHYPLQLDYQPGGERELAECVKSMIEALSDTALEEAQEQFNIREMKKKTMMARGMAELESSPVTAQSTFASIIREFPDDAELRGRIGEALLKAKLYEPAVEYLSVALDMKPDMLPFYNIIGMALRKLERFPVAETYFLRASKYLRHDPNLYFNIGRLYVDWEKWPKAQKAAEMALRLNPDFVEAQKLLNYVQNKLQAQ